MTKTLETTAFGRYGDVIITAGGTVHTMNGWEQIFGIFGSEEDARSQDADNLALATVGRDALTDDQAAMAERNTEALSD